jgi:hypothetical protein
VPKIPDKKSGFEKMVFTQPESNETITLISENECEIGSGGGSIRLAQYSRQDNKLRVVAQSIGGTSVNYYDILPVGLQGQSPGEFYLLPAPLMKYREQKRIAREAEATRLAAQQRAAEQERQRQRMEEERQAAEQKRRLTASRDAIMNDIRQFLSKGTVFNGTFSAMWSWQVKDPKLPFQITITGVMTTKNDPDNANSLDQEFRVPAHFIWLREIDPYWAGGELIKEFDGEFVGQIKYVYNQNLKQEWQSTMQFFDTNAWSDNDPYTGTRHKISWPHESGSVWNGTQFVGKGEHSISLIKKH